MGSDEILDELHAVRARLLEEAGGSLTALGDWLKKREAESEREVVRLPPRTVHVEEDEAA